jgi:hypothetical protein
MKNATAQDVAAALNTRITDLARELCGDPNQDLSSPQQLRFGTHGSVAVEIAGDNAGRWFDHEQRLGGDGLELIKQRRGLANGAALGWARQWLGWPPVEGSCKTTTPAKRNQAPDAPDTPDGPPTKVETDQETDRSAPFSSTMPLAASAETDALSPPENITGDGNADRSALPSESKNAKKAADDAKRAAKVAEIISGCEDPGDTCVETYLCQRGISAPSLPPSIRYLPNAYNQYGALVALATDAEGLVHGLQQIYLTADGRKAPLKVQKRTNKAHDGWSDISAVRMPGRTPIILCEGVETALSVWLATGQETWACLGISNIARAPLPDGAAVMIARDGDEPNSKADQKLREAVTPYHRAVGPRWMISAVARIYAPGCKADCALILEGPQGIRKSSALMMIAKPWFADRLSDLSSKDAAMETRGVWIIEIAELDTMSRAVVSTIKAFMSRTQDRFRPPYGKRLVDLPRQCVFAGSVNPEGGYLKDPTGGRRFWPVVCSTINLETLQRDREQLWAEARDRFRGGEQTRAASLAPGRNYGLQFAP